MSRIKQLGKDSLIYGVGGVLSKSVAFFLLPIYTRIFTPAEYGTLEMLTVISSALGALTMMGMDSAQSMYFFKEKQEGKKAQRKVVSAVLQFRITWGIVATFAAALCAPLLNAALFEGELTAVEFIAAFLASLLLQIMTQSAEVMRLLFKPWGFVSATISQAALAGVLVLVCVIWLDQGILGYFAGGALASLFVGLISWISVREYVDFSQLHWKSWRQLVLFGAPLVPAELAFYVMSTSDRWFVQRFHGAEALGIFAIGAKFSMLLAIVVETFRKAWWPIAMDSMHSEDGPQTFRLISVLYTGLASAAAVALAAFSPWVLKWFTSPEFHSGWRVTVVLAWQSVFYGFFLIASAGIWRAEKTYLNFYLMSGAAAFGVLMNIMLVPSFAGIGAAVATSITYLLWVIATLLVSEKHWKVGFPFPLLGLQVLLGAVFCFGMLNAPLAEDRPLLALCASIVIGIQLGLCLKAARSVYK